MSTKIIETTIKTVDHPLEDFFNIEPNTTQVVKTEQKTELVQYEEYDEKDKEIEENFQEIFDKAMNGYETLTDDINGIEGRFRARVSEVAVQHLNTALQAASKKADLKQTKDKLQVAAKKANTPNTVNIMGKMDRNDLVEALRQLQENKNNMASVEPVEGEFQEIDSDDIDLEHDE